MSTECERCKATMPPPVDRGVGVKGDKSLPPSVRKCNACGWDPEAPKEASKKASKGSKIAPPTAGKSFGSPKRGR